MELPVEFTVKYNIDRERQTKPKRRYVRQSQLPQMVVHYDLSGATALQWLSDRKRRRR